MILIEKKLNTNIDTVYGVRQKMFTWASTPTNRRDKSISKRREKKICSVDATTTQQMAPKAECNSKLEPGTTCMTGVVLDSVMEECVEWGER